MYRRPQESSLIDRLVMNLGNIAISILLMNIVAATGETGIEYKWLIMLIIYLSSLVKWWCFIFMDNFRGLCLGNLDPRRRISAPNPTFPSHTDARTWIKGTGNAQLLAFLLTFTNLNFKVNLKFLCRLTYQHSNIFLLYTAFCCNFRPPCMKASDPILYILSDLDFIWF